MTTLKKGNPLPQKNFSHVSFDDFVSTFNNKFGDSYGVKKGKDFATFEDIQKRPTEGFLDAVLKNVTRDITTSEAATDPIGAGGQAFLNIIDMLGQKIPTAAIPHGDEGFVEKLGRGKSPGEFVPDLPGITIPNFEPR